MMALTKLLSLSKLMFLSLRMGILMLSLQCGNPVSLDSCHTAVASVAVTSLQSSQGLWRGFDHPQLTEAED